MSESSSTDSSGGISFILFVVFLVLKLTDTIDWSWWWVTSPLWIPVAIVLAIFGVAAILVFLKSIAS
jgi:hypothetical protein